MELVTQNKQTTQSGGRPMREKAAWSQFSKQLITKEQCWRCVIGKPELLHLICKLRLNLKGCLLFYKHQQSSIKELVWGDKASSLPSESSA